MERRHVDETDDLALATTPKKRATTYDRCARLIEQLGSEVARNKCGLTHFQDDATTRSAGPLAGRLRCSVVWLRTRIAWASKLMPCSTKIFSAR